VLAIEIEYASSPDFLLSGKSTGVKHDGSVIPLPDRRRNAIQANIHQHIRDARHRFE